MVTKGGSDMNFEVGDIVKKRILGWVGEVVKVNPRTTWVTVAWRTGARVGRRPMLCHPSELEK
jgi:heat shock protein HspQ